MIRSCLAALLALSACGKGPELACDDGDDNDADGFADCADQDCAASCGEVCDNLLDDNADGAVDCLDPLCAAFDGCTTTAVGDEVCDNAADDDQDRLVDCDDPDCDVLCDSDGDGWVDAAFGGLDCDDDEPGVHPEGIETPYNTFDDDCDPGTPDDDLDGDSFLLADDCGGAHDDDAAVYPGAPEVCGDAILNDCGAGVAPPRSFCFGDRPSSTADMVALGPSASGLAGYALANAGDTNADGRDDFVVGAYGDGVDFTGAAYLVEANPFVPELSLSLAPHEWVGETLQSWAGFSMAAGADVVAVGADVDGKDDVLIGVPNADLADTDAGVVYAVPVFGAASVDLVGVTRRILGEAAGDGAGWSIAALQDANGDGKDDVLVGSPFSSRDLDEAGVAHVVFGPVLGAVDLATVPYRVAGAAAGDRAGCAVGAAGDLGGDGLADVLIGACGGAGAAAQFSTAVLADRTLGDADGILRGLADEDALGSALAGGDVDGDGLSDMVVGAPTRGGGAVYVVHGPADGDLTADAVLSAEALGDLAGTSVAVGGDIDGDGATDLLIGAPGSDLGGEDAGVAYAVFGPFAGSSSLADADVRVIGGAPFEGLGRAVAAGDFDGDGLGDLLVGAPYHDGLNPAAGAVYTFTFDW